MLTKKLLIIFTLILGLNAKSELNYVSFSEFDEINEKIAKKWSDLEINLADNEWVDKKLETPFPGPVYSKGVFGLSARRHIQVENNFYYNVDTINIPTSFLEKSLMIGANIFVAYHAPFIEAAYDRNKSISRATKHSSYYNALTTNVLNIEKLPTSYKDVEHMAEGEILSTTISKGIYTKLGASLNGLLGLNSTIDIPIGPRLKISTSRSIKIAIEKAKDNKVLITLTNTKHVRDSLGVVFGVLFEDILHLPIDLKIHGQKGFAPLMLSSKNIKEEFAIINYELDLDKKAAQDSFDAFLNRDFTIIEDNANALDSGVKLDYTKVGESNANIKTSSTHLILARFSKTSINETSDTTTTIDQNEFKYHNQEVSTIKDRKFLSGKEKEVYTHKAILPEKLENPSFILENEIIYQDSKTKGSEILSFLKKLKKFDHITNIKLSIDKKKDYQTFYLKYTSRFSLRAIDQFLKCVGECNMKNMAQALGLNSKESLERVIQKNKWSHSNKNNYKRSIYLKFKSLNKKLGKLRQLSNMKDKAQALLKLLKSSKYAPIVHRYLVLTAPKDEFQTKGVIHANLR